MMPAGKPIVRLRRDLLPECTTCEVKHPADPTGKECVSAHKAKSDLLRRQLHREIARRAWAESIIGMLETKLLSVFGRAAIRPSRWERLRPQARTRWLANAEREMAHLEEPMKHRHVWNRIGANAEKGYEVACEVCTATGFKLWQQHGGGVQIHGVGSEKETQLVTGRVKREDAGVEKNKES